MISFNKARELSAKGDVVPVYANAAREYAETESKALAAMQAVTGEK